MLERELSIVYNPLSGNGRVETLIKQHLGQIDSAKDLPVCELSKLESSLGSISGDREQLLAIYGGDGTQTSVLTAVLKAIREGKVNSEQITCCLMGNKNSGGERVMARTLGMDNRTLAEVLSFLEQQEQKNATTLLRPHWLETENGTKHPIWWHYASGNGIVHKSLLEIESLRLSGEQRHLMRALKTAVKIWQTFRYQAKVEATVGSKQLQAAELIYLIPPFLALSQLNFSSLERTTVLTLHQEGLTQAEFNQ